MGLEKKIEQKRLVLKSKRSIESSRVPHSGLQGSFNSVLGDIQIII